MSWLLFLDESGHDHRTMPYEVHGGIAIHASRLWPFIQAVRTLEQATFGLYLHDHGSEIKGSKLLARSRFVWESQSARFDDLARRKHVLNFFNSAAQGRSPRRDEFTAYGQACTQFAAGLCQLLRGHDAFVFASMIPPMPKPAEMRDDVPRKDIVFLLERYFYFLREKNEAGLLVFDQTEKQNDRLLVARMEQYFSGTATGIMRAQWVVPVPLFVESDMAHAVQVADVCVYCMNWGLRLKHMNAPVREEIREIVRLLEPTIWNGRGARHGRAYKTKSVVFVPDPYSARAGQK